MCSPIIASVAQQVQNPVTKLPTDNNGVVIDLPAIPASGSATVAGSLIFGIGTQSNNALGGATRFNLDSVGNLVTVFNSQTLKKAFFDSGSNGLFFPDNAIAVCSAASIARGFYCPATSLSLTATVIGANNGNAGNVSFSVANAVSLASGSPGFTAFNNLAGPFGVPGSFDWGLPFFYGHRIYTAIEQRNTPAGVGPYIAF